MRSLSEWESFYVITGSSAAALTGLMFVVVALAADRRVNRPADGMKAFSTPTVAHFSIVLFVASIMSMPFHDATWLTFALGGAASAGLASTGRAGVRMATLRVYTAVAEDWAWHVILPFLTYVVLAVAAVLLHADQEVALALVAGVTLALLFIGIRNAWDVAVFLVTVPEENPVDSTPPESPATAQAPRPG